MAYFPFFIELSDKQGLLVGGGAVALRKAKKLLPFGVQLRVVAKEVLPELAAMAGPSFCICRRAFREVDTEGCFFVIAATDDRALNARIAEHCRRKNILVNTVDDAEHCSFLFPALVREGSLTAGITTGGASPYAAAEVKNRLLASLPPNLGELLEELAALRKAARLRIPDAGLRAELLREAAEQCLSRERSLTGEEVDALFLQKGAKAAAQAQIQTYGNAGADIAAETKAVAGVGSVALVGAGCGAYDSLTLRGLRILRTAQTLVYDDLLDARLLAFVPERCVCIYAGKRMHAHSMPQAEINRILIREAKAGRRVVRLKGGDPFVFGRGGEEVEALRQAGIPVTVVPGVSSAIAMPALAGIPLTLRGKSRGFLVMTAHVGEQVEGSMAVSPKEKSPAEKSPIETSLETASAEDFLPQGLREAAAFPGTLVFLMGHSQLELLTRKLMDYGRSPRQPAAVIHGETDGSIRTVRGTLETIAGLTKAAGLPAPAVIVAGESAAEPLLSAPSS